MDERGEEGLEEKSDLRAWLCRRAAFRADLCSHFEERACVFSLDISIRARLRPLAAPPLTWVAPPLPFLVCLHTDSAQKKGLSFFVHCKKNGTRKEAGTHAEEGPREGTAAKGRACAHARLCVCLRTKAGLRTVNSLFEKASLGRAFFGRLSFYAAFHPAPVRRSPMPFSCARALSIACVRSPV